MKELLVALLLCILVAFPLLGGEESEYYTEITWTYTGGVLVPHFVTVESSSEDIEEAQEVSHLKADLSRLVAKGISFTTGLESFGNFADGSGLLCDSLDLYGILTEPSSEKPQVFSVRLTGRVIEEVDEAEQPDETGFIAVPTACTPAGLPTNSPMWIETTLERAEKGHAITEFALGVVTLGASFAGREGMELVLEITEATQLTCEAAELALEMARLMNDDPESEEEQPRRGAVIYNGAIVEGSGEEEARLAEEARLRQAEQARLEQEALEKAQAEARAEQRRIDRRQRAEERRRRQQELRNRQNMRNGSGSRSGRSSSSRPRGMQNLYAI